MAVTGRAAQKIIRRSLQKAKPKWDIAVPSQEYRNIVDLMVKTPKYNVLIKMKTTSSGYFRHSSFKEEQLSAWGRHQNKAKKNLSLIFLYFIEERCLVSIDIETLLGTKISKVTLADALSMGYSIPNWKKIDRYFTVMIGFKERKFYRKGRCTHYWLIESRDEAFMRSKSRKYSMGHCKKCGRVRTKFENFLPEETFTVAS